MTHPPGSDEALSLWIDTTPSTQHVSRRGDPDVVAIAGAGITGITAAHLLSKAGKSAVLVDKGRIAVSETGHTTAQIVEATDAGCRDLVGDGWRGGCARRYRCEERSCHS